MILLYICSICSVKESSTRKWKKEIPYLQGKRISSHGDKDRKKITNTNK
jgi:hypothetical protein